MGQIKIYGLKENLNKVKKELSDTIHECVVEAFSYPQDKKFHRFIGLEKEDFYFSTDRTDNYTIIEISIFEGRKKETKKKLINLLFEKIEKIGITPQDLEITIFETVPENWGIRGKSGDELKLNYKVNV